MSNHPTRPPDPRQSWVQPSLYEPDRIRLDVVVWLDTQPDYLTWGFTVCEGEEQQLVRMEAFPFRPLHCDTTQIAETIAGVIHQERMRLVPFP